MRRFFFTALIFLITSLVIPIATQAERYAQCDACGLCKDTSKSSASSTIYVQPASWSTCFKCLYPSLNPTPPIATPTPVDCQHDEMNRPLVFKDINGTVIGNNLYFRCDTLLMSPYNPPPPLPTPPNEPINIPQSGRKFSDLGCISVDTANHTFSDPNASVDVIQILLNLVIGATGAVGTILVIAAAARLILSKGDPEKIREGKKTLTNVVLGLLFALFGLFIFRFFAAQVLRIPGFN